MQYSLPSKVVSLATLLFCLFLPTLFSMNKVAASMTKSWMPMGMQVDHAVVRIHNNILRYGQYCGPGPDDKYWSHIKPVDALDQQCKQHDQAYRSCLEALSKDTGFKVPTFVHQIMAMRGIIAPLVVLKWAFNVAPNYMTCMHAADHDLVVGFEKVLENDLFPKWWAQPSEAPAGTQGVEGFKEACALGIKGTCAVSSKRLFEIMLGMFQSGVRADTRVAPQILSSSTSTTATKSSRTTTSPHTNYTSVATVRRIRYYLF